jgi:diguanylate cyclase (GGDEF)-like protein
VKENRRISMIYGIFLIIGLLLCIGSLIFIPIETHTAYDTTAKIELLPTDITIENEDVREFHFKDIDWKKNGSCLNFNSTHQEVEVKADGELIFQRKSVQTIWGHTPGFAWEYIEIPVDTDEVTVTVTACYPEVRDMTMTFYQGFGKDMVQSVFRQEIFTAIISFLDVCMGFILLVYGIAMYKRSSIGVSMVYLGMFTVLLGIWSLTENGVVALLLVNRAACSFISFTALALIGLPFILFVRSYLQTDDKYMYKIMMGINILNIILTFPLQIFGIRDMKQTLMMTHISMVVAVLYLPYSMLRILCKHNITRRFWVTICSLLSMCPPLAYSLFMYYSGSHNVDSYANVFLFIFVAIFAVDVSFSIIRDVDAGKKAEIYQELAEKDMLTGCYNRNAYRNDTENWVDLQGVLLVACDLNNLKQCNDTLGHTFGDQYIIDSANILKKVFGQYGKVYRIGGDEFCIIIPDGSKCNIRNLISILIEEERIYNKTSSVIYLEIACGYAEFEPQKDLKMEDIRIRADEQMYENKRELKKMRIV